MRDLLESVQTDRLQSAYDKYLPAVLNNNSVKTSAKQTLAENRVVITGDKSAKTAAENSDVERTYDNVVELKRLAGL